MGRYYTAGFLSRRLFFALSAAAFHGCGHSIRPMTALNTPKTEIEILLVWRKSALVEQLVQSFLATIARGFKDEAGELKNISVTLEDSRAGHVPLPVSMPRGKTLLPCLQGGAAKGSTGTGCAHCCHFGCLVLL